MMLPYTLIIVEILQHIFSLNFKRAHLTALIIHLRLSHTVKFMTRGDLPLSLTTNVYRVNYILSFNEYHCVQQHPWKGWQIYGTFFKPKKDIKMEKKKFDRARETLMSIAKQFPRHLVWRRVIGHVLIKIKRDFGVCFRNLYVTRLFFV